MGREGQRDSASKERMRKAICMEVEILTHSCDALCSRWIFTFRRMKGSSLD